MESRKIILMILFAGPQRKQTFGYSGGRERVG